MIFEEERINKSKQTFFSWSRRDGKVSTTVTDRESRVAGERQHPRAHLHGLPAAQRQNQLRGHARERQRRVLGTRISAGIQRIRTRSGCQSQVYYVFTSTKLLLVPHERVCPTDLKLIKLPSK